MKIIIAIMLISVSLICLGCSLDKINASEPDFSKIDKMDDLLFKNRPPVIECIDCKQTLVRPNTQVKIRVQAYDPDDDELHYAYEATGDIMHKSDLAYWTVPDEPGAYTIVVKVSDDEFTIVKKLIVKVEDTILNQPDHH